MDLDGEGPRAEDFVGRWGTPKLPDLLPQRPSPAPFLGDAEKKQHTLNRLARQLGLLLICFVLIMATFLALDRSTITSAEANVLEHCGTNQAEARQAGCAFDIVSFSWLPAACHDAELMDEFASLQTWTWYRAEGRPTTIGEGASCFTPECSAEVGDLVPVAAESVRRGEHDVLYVTRQYHLWHCAFMWRKMHRAMIHGGRMDGYVSSMHHTRHCSGVLAQANVSSAIDTVISVKFPSCLSTGSEGWVGRPQDIETIPSE